MKKSRKLFLSVAMLVLAVMAVTSTTFAWITSNNTVKASYNSASVSKDEKMLLIETAAASTEGGLPTLGVELTQAAPASVLMKDLKVAKATTTEAPIVTAGTLYTKSNSAATVNVDYIEVEYKLWCSEKGAKIMFNPAAADNKITSGIAENASADYSFNNADRAYFTELAKDSTYKTMAEAMLTANKYTASAANAARLMFNSDPAKIWDPNAGKGYEDATAYGTFDMQAAFNNAQMNSAAIPAPYASSYTAIKNATEVATVSSTAADKINYNGTDYYPASVKVQVWLEGSDPDCFNAILGQLVSFSINFYVTFAA